MSSPDLSELLAQVTEIVERAGVLLSEEWNRPDGPRGWGDKAVIFGGKKRATSSLGTLGVGL
ncbi:hypothetical protein D3C76_1633820 [compost metagenome]|uniref:Uncharacterized protein n=1 Tax=Pseudomonas fluorescens TaxID=294 RepID=A0A5E7KDN3_PSEFL|nr:hypothetical protein PS647_03395 [Pseudomonas fluorescens]VVO56601.1 hypothetical protein PS843_00561 [Pseudomonas fluorescens]VVO98044.1 hypothetical protein PS862_02694 [Pseudomonas fluorescens]